MIKKERGSYTKIKKRLVRLKKEEKINFIVDTFDSAVASHLNGGIILPEDDEVWLNRYITSSGDFPMALDADHDLDAAYKAALNLKRL